MFNFLKESIRDLKHVVWPTRDETRKYFSMVLTVLVLFGLYLFLANTVFSEIIFGLKDYFGSGTPNNAVFDPNTISIGTGTITSTGIVK